jgi:hypothetical protein
MNLIFDQRDERELTRQLDRAALDIERGIMRGLSEGAELVAARARADHDYTSRSGRLEENTVDVPAQRKGAVFEAAVAARTPYAAAIEGGAAPHGIKPKRTGGMLKFRIGGRWVSTRFVSHPGNKAYRFLQNAIDAMQDDVADRVEIRVLEAAAKAGFEIG